MIGGWNLERTVGEEMRCWWWGEFIWTRDDNVLILQRDSHSLARASGVTDYFVDNNDAACATRVRLGVLPNGEVAWVELSVDWMAGKIIPAVLPRSESTPWLARRALRGKKLSVCCQTGMAPKK